MSWKNISLKQGCKLFISHNFTYMSAGQNFSLCVDEYNNGQYIGHGEHSTDKNNVVESITAPTMEGCLESLIAKIESKSNKK